MAKTITLNDNEWQLLVDLLQSERNQLPTEIHHTDSPEYKDGLSKRLQLVDKLLATFGSTPVRREGEPECE
jgi:hypothetical protein